MPAPAAIRAQSPGYDTFLRAPVGEDERGAWVSVMSALARSGADPWQEAAALAQLPRTDAADRLDGIIAALKDVPAALTGHHDIALRLAALLPQAKSLSTDVHGVTGFISLSPRTQIAIYLVLVAVLLIGQVIATQTTGTASQNGVTDAPVTDTAGERP